MKKVRITAVRQTVYEDLMAQYENPIEHACDVAIGQSWISVDGQCPDGFCPSAWDSVRPFVESLARGEGNFFTERIVAPDGTIKYSNGWMKNPMSAMISCNDGFRPVSFLIEMIE
ncbi:MAG: TIGR04076 family protein [Prevotella sp.]|nr:TIGR04076 family protein [Prevotella sp.]